MPEPYPRLHLLSLPREIRNIVYSYLTKSVYLCGIRKIRTRHATILLDNAPHLNVLLVHSRLHDEYKESACFTNLSASLNTWWEEFMFLSPVKLGSEFTKRDTQALAHVKAIDLYCLYSPFYLDTGELDSLGWTVDSVFGLMPQIHTIRLNLKFHFQHFQCGTVPDLYSLKVHQCNWHALKLVQVASGRMTPQTSDESTEYIPCLALVYSSKSLKVPLWTEKTALEWNIPNIPKTHMYVLKITDLVNPGSIIELPEPEKIIYRMLDWKERTCEMDQDQTIRSDH